MSGEKTIVIRPAKHQNVSMSLAPHRRGLWKQNLRPCGEKFWRNATRRHAAVANPITRRSDPLVNDTLQPFPTCSKFLLCCLVPQTTTSPSRGGEILCKLTVSWRVVAPKPGPRSRELSRQSNGPKEDTLPDVFCHLNLPPDPGA